MFTILELVEVAHCNYSKLTWAAKHQGHVLYYSKLVGMAEQLNSSDDPFQNSCAKKPFSIWMSCLK